jgi:hypothetical protein
MCIVTQDARPEGANSKVCEANGDIEISTTWKPGELCRSAQVVFGAAVADEGLAERQNRGR